MPAPRERGPWEVESGLRGVCDGTGTDIVGAKVAGVESERHGVCDGIGTMKVGAVGSRV